MNKFMQGEIVYKRGNEYLVDIGTGVDATMQASEALVDHQVGDKVIVSIVQTVKGEVFVSEKEAEKHKALSKFEEFIENDKLVSGTIIDFKNGQFIVDLGENVQGSCYIKNLVSGYIQSGEDYIGKTYDFYIVGLSRSRDRRYELSREKIINEEKEQNLEKFNSLFTVDEEYSGVVTNNIPSGVVVTVNDFECFIPRSEISYNPNNIPEIGEKVNFKIIRLDSGRLNMVGSIKATLVDPWLEIAKFNTEDTYTGVIERILKYGLFVKLTDDIQGLIHISELSHDYIDTIEGYNVGDTIEYKIIEINEKQRKVRLSVKALTPSKYMIAKEKFKIGEHLSLPVTKFYRTGVFVRLMENYDIFVKNSEIYNHSQVRPMLKYNTKIDFIVTEMNDEKEEIIISNQAYVENENAVFKSAMEE